MPHGHCYLWTPSILWLHVVSDVVIFLSYSSIPIALIYFVLKKKTLPFNWIFWMFAAFIVLCGTTHIMSVWTTWNPVYRIEGIVKAMTAIISSITAVTLWFLIPKALALPTPLDLQAINNELEHRNEVIKSEKENAEKNLHDLKESQEKYKEKTASLEKLNQITVGRELRIAELKAEIKKLKGE